MMSVRCRRQDQDTLFVKGAPEAVIARCSRVSHAVMAAQLLSSTGAVVWSTHVSSAGCPTARVNATCRYIAKAPNLQWMQCMGALIMRVCTLAALLRGALVTLCAAASWLAGRQHRGEPSADSTL